MVSEGVPELPVPGVPAGHGPWTFLLAVAESLWEVGELDRLARCIR
jgi:hypothetical protein